MGTRNFVIGALLAFCAGASPCQAEEPDPLAFLSDGSLEQGQSPDPDKVLSILVKVQVVRVKVTKNQSTPASMTDPLESAFKSATADRAPAASKTPGSNPVPAAAAPATTEPPPATTGGASTVDFGGTTGAQEVKKEPKKPVPEQLGIPVNLSPKL
ncbi:MAG: hypothetical protein HY074_01810 [Deltaproteobacteria bacterium]|nr:hypothetical protein [Deltaproteobacteria bacterium]